MNRSQPVGVLDARYSNPGAVADSWETVEEILDTAIVFWFTSVRRDGRPHTTPLLAIWMDDVMFISTGAEEQKAKNLAENQNCSLTTGCNQFDDGYDVVLEGTAQIESTDDVLNRLTVRFRDKYGWPYVVKDGKIVGDHDNVATVYRIQPTVVYGFGKGNPFTHTRWSFA